MIYSVQSEIADGELLPDRAAELLTQLSALIGNINDEIRKRDVEYSHILLKWLETEEKANRAKIKAECSPEYLVKREARDTKELALELIRSLKYFLRSKEEEFRVSKNL
ncbi:MAG: hypothetical protein AABY22_21270 [Nanoarchaeota archaeon]